ncbi:MAG: hypothetical protein KJ734_15310, partial [Chloroflexi bacterium]|nr:hypothetical protein [Chloroflexota bacterium]
RLQLRRVMLLHWFVIPAFYMLLRLSGVGPLLGRSCCFYDHEPICGTRACFKAQECTFVTGVTYSCPGHCVLDGICPGSVDPAYRAFWETNVYTTHY